MVLNLSKIGLQAREVKAWRDRHEHAAIKWAFLLLNKTLQKNKINGAKRYVEELVLPRWKWWR